MSHVIPLCLWAEFRRLDISCKLSAKQPESTTENSIWQPLAFANMIREISKSCRNLVLQRGDHVKHVVPHFLLGRISRCGYLLPIECEAIGINTKQKDLEAFGIC